MAQLQTFFSFGVACWQQQMPARWFLAGHGSILTGW